VQLLGILALSSGSDKGGGKGGGGRLVFVPKRAQKKILSLKEIDPKTIRQKIM
jgi:hypothetical protein